jgi:acyl-lipid omega-6 desaturase (Delta-12 desaturase)
MVLSASTKLGLKRLRGYQAASSIKASWQTISTFSLYAACVVALYMSLHVSVWLTILLALPTGSLIVRIFMLQHDCGHNSLFRSRRLNGIVGGLCSLVTLTPFAYWRRLHARHHESWNNLDGRGIPADFFSDCLTVAEYAALRPVQRVFYRVTHYPALIHLLLPPAIFIVLYRLPFDMPPACRRERLSVLLLDCSLLLLFGGLSYLFGVRAVMLVHLPALAFASIVGIWLFSVQHRFEEAQWSSGADWAYDEASLEGASYLKLPRILQWFSGNIGLHHLHHLRPGIPNYRLQACHDDCTEVSSIATVITLRDALKAPSFALWDESLRRMVPFAS